MVDPLMHTAWLCEEWLCEECGYMQSHILRALSHVPDYCPRCSRDSVWSPKIVGQGQEGGGSRL
jgi:hypothetical protein